MTPIFGANVVYDAPLKKRRQQVIPSPFTPNDTLLVDPMLKYVSAWYSAPNEHAERSSNFWPIRCAPISSAITQSGFTKKLKYVPVSVCYTPVYDLLITPNPKSSHPNQIVPISRLQMFFADNWSGKQGVRKLLPSMASLTILTASATLLGPEVRQHLFKEVSELYVCTHALLFLVFKLV